MVSNVKTLLLMKILSNICNMYNMGVKTRRLTIELARKIQIKLLFSAKTNLRKLVCKYRFNVSLTCFIFIGISSFSFLYFLLNQIVFVDPL